MCCQRILATSRDEITGREAPELAAASAKLA
jgi:hypothetical protein